MALPRAMCRAPVPRAQGGFLLPLSFGTALVLLLASLSVQTAALQGTTLAAAELSRRQHDDALASAAQRVAAQLSGVYSCLLPLESAAWVQPVPGCAPELDPAPLQQGMVGGVGYRLVAWDPAAGGNPGELRLELAAAGGARRYALIVAPEPNRRVLSVRGMGR